MKYTRKLRFISLSATNLTTPLANFHTENQKAEFKQGFDKVSFNLFTTSTSYMANLWFQSYIYDQIFIIN